MELKWLDDYLALVNCRSFTKAAAVRHITQPAFSRRIRALEHWLGVQLVDRSRYPTSFTEAGIAFVDQATQLRAQILGARDAMHSLVHDRDVPLIVCQHALAVSYLPALLRALPTDTVPPSLRVDTRNYHDALELFTGGTPDFLLCFAIPDARDPQERQDVLTRQVGTDRLIPVSSRPPAHWQERIGEGGDLPVLTYPASSFLGRALGETVYPQLTERFELRASYESALSEALRAMALKDFGIAWLPESIIGEELERGALWQLPEQFPTLELLIRLHRFDRQYTDAGEALWRALTNEKAPTQA